MIRIVLLFFVISMNSFGQVGIGTTSPETDLHIAGSALIQDELKTTKLGSTNNTDINFKLITRLTNSSPLGEITKLDVDNLSVAPINILKYRFVDISRDNLEDIDLSFESSRYLIAISNFRYIGDPITKQNVSGHDRPSIGNFITRVFTATSFSNPSIDTWHIQIQNTYLDAASESDIEYEVTLIVYDKSYYRSLDPIEVNLGGSNTGNVSAPNIK